MNATRLFLTMLFGIAVAACGGGSTPAPTVATAPPFGTHSISGTVTGANGVTVNLTGTATATATTDASGNYAVTGLYDGAYTLTPSLAGYTFTPISTTVTMSGTNITGKNFSAAAYTGQTYTLSGQVTGPYVEGVTVTLGGTGSGTTVTDASGNYSFTNVPAGTYTVTPSLPGYIYSPSAPSVPVGANTTQNFAASSAIPSFSISGTVSYAGTKTGRVFIRAGQTAGTSIALSSGSGTYTIRGLQAGSYAVTAEMDTLNSAKSNATNPAGSAGTVTVAADLAGVDIVITDTVSATPPAPTGLSASPSDGMAFIFWNPTYDASNTENASAYKIYWGTDTAATNGGSIIVPAKDDGCWYLHTGLANFTDVYYRVSAMVGNTESAPSAVFGPVPVGPTTGTNVVSGTVTFDVPATGPMLVGLFSDTGDSYFTRIAAPVSPQSYSVAGVLAGAYTVFAAIDMNNDGQINLGDIQNTADSIGRYINVAGNMTRNIDLSSAGARANVRTLHTFDGAVHNYELELHVVDGTKHVAAVTLVSGKNVTVPFDMIKETDFWTWQGLNSASPAAGDSYVFKVTFSDGTTKNISGSVSAVLNSFAQNLVAQTTAPGAPTAPLFTWAAPASPPASYVYYLSLTGADASWIYPFPWDLGLPSTATSVLYNVNGSASKAALTPTVLYTWQVEVTDSNGNRATRQIPYTP